MTAPGPAALLAEVEAGLTPIFRSIDIAEGEIELAQGRHPAAADRIYHSFMLLSDTPGRGTPQRPSIPGALPGDTRPGSSRGRHQARYRR